MSLYVSFSVSLAVSFSPHKPLEFRKVGVSLAVSLVVSLAVSLAVSFFGVVGWAFGWRTLGVQSASSAGSVAEPSLQPRRAFGVVAGGCGELRAKKGR